MSKGAIRIHQGSSVRTPDGAVGRVAALVPQPTGQRGRPVTLAMVQVRDDKGHFAGGRQSFRLNQLELIEDK